MKIFYKKIATELPKKSLTNLISKKAVYQGHIYSYQGFALHKLICKEKASRCFKIILNILLGIISLGISATFKGYRRNFARAVVELKIGQEKQHFYLLGSKKTDSPRTSTEPIVTDSLQQRISKPQSKEKASFAEEECFLEQIYSITGVKNNDKILEIFHQLKEKQYSSKVHNELGQCLIVAYITGEKDEELLSMLEQLEVTAFSTQDTLISIDDLNDDNLKAIVAHSPYLQELNLKQTKITDEGLKALLCLTQLKSLNLSDSDISSRALKYISKLHTLEDLDLRNCQKLENGYSHLASLTNLRSLNLNFCEGVGDADMLPIVQSCPKLTSIYVNGSLVTHAFIAAAAQLAHLNILDIENCVSLNDDMGQDIAKMNLLYLNVIDCDLSTRFLKYVEPLKNLFRLRLGFLTGDEKYFDSLKNLPSLGNFQTSQNSKYVLDLIPQLKSLNNLTLAHRKLADQDLEKILENKNLSFLHLGSIANISEAGFQKIVQHEKLYGLSLTDCMLSDSAVGALCFLPDLESLTITNAPHLTDGFLKKLAECEPLVYFDCQNCPGFTEEGLDELAESKPDMEFFCA